MRFIAKGVFQLNAILAAQPQWALPILVIDVGLLHVLAFQYRWWTLASLSKFRHWYDSFGALLWVLKILSIFILVLMMLAMLAFLTRWLYRAFSRYAAILNPVWLTVIYCAIAMIVGEVHPFSRVPMYKEIRQHSDLFFLEDERGEVIPLAKVGMIPSAFINKHFDTYINTRHLNYDEVFGDTVLLHQAGQYLYDRSIHSVRITQLGVSRVRMVLLHCKVHEDVCKRIVVYERKL